jgi:hypothetical protein
VNSEAVGGCYVENVLHAVNGSALPYFELPSRGRSLTECHFMTGCVFSLNAGLDRLNIATQFRVHIICKATIEGWNRADLCRRLVVAVLSSEGSFPLMHVRVPRRRAKREESGVDQRRELIVDCRF